MTAEEAYTRCLRILEEEAEAWRRSWAEGAQPETWTIDAWARYSLLQDSADRIRADADQHGIILAGVPNDVR